MTAADLAPAIGGQLGYLSEALGLLLRTASGRVHPLAAYLGWLRDAGFEPPEHHRLVDRAQAVLLVAPQAHRRACGGRCHSLIFREFGQLTVRR